MAVDRIVEREGREAPCRTHEIPLGMPDRPGRAARGRGRRRGESARTWLGATGTPRPTCCAVAASAPRAGAADRAPSCPTCWPRPPSPPRHEQARSLGDVLLRRTRLGLLDARRLRPIRLRGRRARGPRDGRRARLGRARAGARARDLADAGARSRGSCRGRRPAAAGERRGTSRRCRPAAARRGGSRGRARADGDRQRDARLVLRSPGPSRSTTRRRERRALVRAGAVDRRRGRRVRPHRPPGCGGRRRRSPAWCR